MAKKGLFSFLRDQLSTVPPVANVNLKGKTVVVVGANTGLGFEAAKHFARMNASKLILACRSQEKGEAAIQRERASFNFYHSSLSNILALPTGLKEATGYSNAELWIVDLAEFSSVKAFVDRALKHLERIDILLLNAAIAGDPQHKATVDGWEQAYVTIVCAYIFLVVIMVICDLDFK